MMGLEEHLLHMFRDDFEFHGDAAASHLGHTTVRAEVSKPSIPVESPSIPQVEPEVLATATVAPAAEQIVASWAADAERELGKIPFFVRGKARRNTERFARERGVATITVETLYDAKAHFSS